MEKQVDVGELSCPKAPEGSTAHYFEPRKVDKGARPYYGWELQCRNCKLTEKQIRDAASK